MKILCNEMNEYVVYIWMHADAFSWVKRDLYLPQDVATRSQGSVLRDSINWF